MKDVPIPPRLAKNDRDRRGYPIPFIVYRDKDGVPHFTVDDVTALDKVLAEGLCGLCGQKLEAGEMWLVGGPVSAFRTDGMFTTPHAHADCARYAIRVCPFLAAAVYSRLIEDRTIRPGAVHEEAELHHDGITPPRPLFFVLGRTSAIRLIDAEDGSGKKYVVPQRPWAAVEFWRHGEQIAPEAAAAIAEAAGLDLSQFTWWPGV